MFRGKAKVRWKFIALYATATLVLAGMILPYLYMLVQSLAPWSEVDRLFVPRSLGLHSYTWLFGGGAAALPRPWFRALGNSALGATLVTLSRVILGALVGYALAMLSFRGRRLIQNFILFHMFYPGIILLVPTFLLIRALGLYDTYAAMILPGLVAPGPSLCTPTFSARCPKKWWRPLVWMGRANYA